MKDLLNKISSYNIFNYLFPGALFAFLGEKLMGLPIIQKDALVGAFLYYFFGLVVSRIGSLVIEPVLKKTGFLKFSDYSDFVNASKDDAKIALFSEINNTYRTLTAMLLSLLLLKGYLVVEKELPWLTEYRYVIVSIGLLFMFLLSYRKQTKYINQRIATHKKNQNTSKIITDKK